jgi:hypothetical protein
MCEFLSDTRPDLPQHDVWTCPAGAATVSRDTTEDTETYAKDAALLALERHTGHRRDAGCTAWELLEIET